MKTILTAAVLVMGAGAAILGPAAEAAPGSNPFQGAYTGSGPINIHTPWTVDISSSGRVTGTSSLSAFGLTTRYKLSGNVTATGAFSYRVDVSTSGHPRGFFVAGAGEADARIAAGQVTHYGNDTLVKGADGTITNTDPALSPIRWTLR
jgi:hypothetical protein